MDPGVPPRMVLAWKRLDGGRLYIATTELGFFEMIPGDRVRYVQMTGEGLQRVDLGPCWQATLTECKQQCEDYLRKNRNGW